MVTEDLWIERLDGAFAVRSNIGGIVSEGHECRQSAHDWIAEYRSEQAEAAAAEAEDYAAESAMLDEIYRQVSCRLDADLPADHPRNNAVRLALKALDGISAPTSHDVREAA